MPHSSNEQVRKETNIIRDLFYNKGLKEHEIMRQLGIKHRVTLYRYFKRIHKEDAKIWKQSFHDNNLVEARAIQLQKVLEDGLAVNIKIRDDERATPRERSEASMTAATFSAHLVKLARQGPSFLLTPTVKATVIQEETKAIEERL